MPLKTIVALLVLSGVIGIVIGYIIRWAISMGKRGSVELEIKKMLIDADEKSAHIISKAEDEKSKLLEEARREAKEKEEKFKKTEDRLINKEELLDKRQIDLDKEAESIRQKTEEISSTKELLEKEKEIALKNLERVSNLSKEDAKEELLKIVEKQFEEDLLIRMSKLENTNKEKLDRRAQDIIVTSIQRYGKSVASDSLTTSVDIPSEEIKGKIIGKEGRNIKAFERASGVEVIIDETPGLIVLSSFDPIRRQVAKLALERLIQDGRIQPAKIEEEVAKAKEEINKIIQKKGEEAVYEVGLYNLDPRIVSILGRLHFRTSYGQNVLAHSVEVSHIAGMIAAELGVDVPIAKAGALVHDIGKAVDHEIQGTHVDIGRRILQKFGADERIITAMESHHDEYPHGSVEAIIVQVADAISGSRPGARNDSIENYIKRLESLEEIANREPGVEKTFALQAGREIRVFVYPEKITDIEAKELARKLAESIEKELKYPGEIKVTVIRETRVIDFAR